MMLKEPDARDLAPPQPGWAGRVLHRPGRVPLLIGAGLLLLLGAGIYGGIRARADTEAKLATETRDAAVPTVNVVHPQAEAPDQSLVLPGQTVAFIDTPIYARSSGYLKSWNFDIGAHVHRGDLLAEIETPELDQQLRQARAQLVQTQSALAQAQANMELAKVTTGRSSVLVKQGWTTQQQGDQDRLNYAGSMAGVDVARANLDAQQAEVDRLAELKSFDRIQAPFDGVITARNTDVGALINAGAGTTASELFHITAIEQLRIYVDVPEVYFPAMHAGLQPKVTLQEYPGQQFAGSMVRTDNAINPATRTLRVEVDVGNPDGKLLPGAYVSVQFSLPGRAQSVVVPANTLLFRSEGPRVGVVRNGGASLVPITIGRDYGDRLEVLSGLTTADEVILNPSDSLADGATVRVAPEKVPEKTAAAK